MMPFSSESCERATNAIVAELKSAFARALTSTARDGNSIHALNTEFLIDQVRQVAVTASGAELGWTIRDGKRCVNTATSVGLSILAQSVGRGRLETAEGILLVVCDLVSDLRPRGRNIRFFNLMVADPFLYPGRELAIWLTVAFALENGLDNANLHHLLPPLNTDFDVLYEELPAGEYFEDMRPGASGAANETWSEYEVRMLAAILPGLADEIRAAQNDDQRARLFQAHTDDVRAYVRDRFFGRVARLVNAAEGSHVQLHPEDDD